MKMMVAILSIGLMVSSAWAEGRKAYQWVDENGGIHLSDSPVDGAKEILLPAPAGYQPPPVASQPATAESSESEVKKPAVEPSFEWVSPTQDQIVWSNLGEFTTRIKVLNLPNDFRFEFSLNGQPFQAQSSGTLEALELSYSWSGLVVGEYKLRLKMLDSKGQVLLDSGDRPFYVRRTLNKAPR